MDEPWRIIKLNWDHFDSLREIMLTALNEAPFAFSVDIDEYATKPKYWWNSYLAPFFDSSTGTVFAALDSQNKIIGIVGLLFNNSNRKKHICALVWLYVREEFRGKKIASSLISQCIRESEARKLKKISLMVNSTQLEAKKLYGKFDFKEAGELKNELCIAGKYYSVFIMEKELNYL